MITVLVTATWAADSVSAVNVTEKKAELTASAGVEKIRYFTLDSPKRLVVDLYGVQPGPHNRSFALGNGFKSLRVGPYEDKTRFVFDVDGLVFPTFNVDTEDQQVVVTWQATQKVAQQVRQEPATVGSVQVTAIDFSSDAGKSNLLISLDGSALATPPVRDNNKVLFSLKNSTLPRALRRVFDTLAFPSAIHSVMPYLVNVGNQPEVRFTVTLKGNVPYQLNKTADGYVFEVTDGQFAAATPAVTGVLPVPVTGEQVPVDSTRPVAMTDSGVTVPTAPAAPAGPVIEQVVVDDKKYTGAKTSLVFDNANVRDILRLIAEISNLNIIASDDVKGNVTLRLIDVPWDQALELVLDITNLGMLQEGNIVRVLPKNKIRSMKEAELTAARSQEKLESLVTEVLTVSYADLNSVSAPARELLSPRGDITDDSRNKFLIITDVPSRIEEIKKLVALLDTPEKQVLIEARIVEVDTEYSRTLGANWGFSYANANDSTLVNNFDIGAGGNFLLGNALGVSGLGTGITFGTAAFDASVLDLRLSALEITSDAKVISTPRVTTLNGKEATISQGTEIPYQSVDANGNPVTKFKRVLLELKVTPVINPDGSIILTIEAKNDSPITGGAGALNTKTAETMVLVKDGNTTVLGGIFIDREGEGDEGVPVLGSIPILGHLFKTKIKTNSKNELLIFITPRILKDS
jgi:type IV pilus assembly protein PilQ